MTRRDRENLKKVRRIAYQVRKFLELGRRRQSRLGGLCSFAAEQICGMARSEGIRGIYIASSEFGHDFCVLPPFLIDVTSTQFGRRKKVEILRWQDRKEPYWSNAHIGFSWRR